MSLFTDAYMGINEDPHWFSQEGSDALFDVFEHLCDGGTIYNCEEFSATQIALFFAIAMRTIQQG